MVGTDRRAGLECLRQFGADRSGATSVEYALIAAVISVALAAAIFSVRESMLNLPFGQIGDRLAGRD